MTWNYAELSKAAKKAGGPEKLVDTLVEFGNRTGHKEMLPIVGMALGLGALGYAGLQKLVKYLKDKEKESAEAAHRARIELIQGIRNYDASHPTNDESENNEIKDGEVEDEIE